MTETMQTIRFLTVDKGKITQWCVTNQTKMFFGFMQYVLDGCDRPEEFVVYDEANASTARLVDVAERFGMRRRTFDERMKDVPTYDADRVRAVATQWGGEVLAV